MKNTILILFLLTQPVCKGQSVKIDTLKFLNSGTLSPAQVLRFPVIKTGDRKADTEINQRLKSWLTANEFGDTVTDSVFISNIRENITALNFEVTRNGNGILSFNITAEGCGAYCTTWTGYFNYSTETWASLNTNRIIDFSGSFREKVLRDKKTQYEAEKATLKNMRYDERSGIDEETYQLALQYYNECESSFEILDIALYKDYLEIIHKCNLPRMIRALGPTIELKYYYSAIKQNLKIKSGT